MESRVETNLSNCDREPIRIPGAIQPHGALVAACESNLSITHASANLSAFFGVDAEAALGRPLADLFRPEDFVRIEHGLSGYADRHTPSYLYSVRARHQEEALNAIVHLSGGCVVVEVEPAQATSSHSMTNLYRATQGAVTRLRTAASLAEMYKFCASHVRDLTGFDRVMVYRFDEAWNGSIVAEQKRDDLEPFLGLHYPASDIPSQARELYARNWLRFIADRDYTPVPILPPSGPDSPKPLDLGHAVLRSVSPIHLEYLRNMGVRASMSISLLKGERLWGLIACHHNSPRHVPYDVRTACELLAQFLSAQLVASEDEEDVEYGVHMAAVRAFLVHRMSGLEDLGLALTQAKFTLMDLIDSDGAAVVVGNSVSRVGMTPGPEEILALRDRLASDDRGEAVATDAVGAAFGMEAMGAVAAGLLALRVTGMANWIMWFRPEQIREVSWAGDPAKSVAKGNGEARLSPRGSFTLWKETVRGRSRPWRRVEVQAATDLRRDIAEVLLQRATTFADQNDELRRAQIEREEMLASERAARSEAERMARVKDQFVATLSHELRTPLNAIVGWTQILRRSADPDTVREAGEVIDRNARTQARMIEDLLDVSRIASGKLPIDIQPLDLASVVAAAIDTTAPAAQAKGVRVERLIDPLVGVEISGDAVRLQQVFWNLLSNAVKFTPKGGKVQIILERVDSHVEVSVTDTGQGIAPEFLPHVFDRFRQEDASTNRKHGGLGLGLSIVRHLVELHGGTVYARSEGVGRGSVFVVSLPLRAVSASDRGRGEHPTRSANPSPQEMLDLSGIALLVVDDEADARELLRRVFEDCGASVTTASSSEEALGEIEQRSFDVVVSDIGMPGDDGYTFIKEFRRRQTQGGRQRIPAVALTAYARPEDRRRVLLSGYQIHVAKPVEPSEIIAVVANLANRV